MLLGGWKEDLDLAVRTSMDSSKGIKAMLEAKLSKAQQMGLLEVPILSVVGRVGG